MRPVALGFLVLVGTCLASLSSHSASEAGTATILDDFDDNALNTAFWQPATTGTGVTFSETNQHLEIEFAPTSAGSLFSAGVRSACWLTGDFDIQLDYELLDWPAGNGVRIGLHPAAGAMERTGDGSGFYVADFGNLTSVPTTHMSGKLRVTRVGTLLSGYYDNMGAWVLVGTGSPSTTEGHTITLDAWSHDIFFGDGLTRLALDNLVLNSGTFVCSVQGDVDCSGAVNAVDALKVLRHNAALSLTQTEPCPDIGSPLLDPFGDVDCASGVNAVDALKILRDNAALGVDQTEPCVDIRQPLYTSGP